MYLILSKILIFVYKFHMLPIREVITICKLIRSIKILCRRYRLLACKSACTVAFISGLKFFKYCFARWNEWCYWELIFVIPNILYGLLTSWFPKNISEEIAFAPPNFFTASSWGVGLDDLALNAARELLEFLWIDYNILKYFTTKADKILTNYFDNKIYAFLGNYLSLDDSSNELDQFEVAVVVALFL